MSHWHGKSDRGVVPMKLPNKAAGANPAEAEAVEGRPRAKGRVLTVYSCRTLRRTPRAMTDSPTTAVTSVAVDRQDPRQEPYAVVPHVRICAGGGE